MADPIVIRSKSGTRVSANTSQTETFNEGTALDSTHGLLAFVRRSGAAGIDVTPTATPTGWTAVTSTVNTGTAKTWLGVYAARGNGTLNSITVAGASAAVQIELRAVTNVKEATFWGTPSVISANSGTSATRGPVTAPEDKSIVFGAVATDFSAGGTNGSGTEGFRWTGLTNEVGTVSDATIGTGFTTIASAASTLSATVTWTNSRANSTVLLPLKTSEPVGAANATLTASKSTVAAGEVFTLSLGGGVTTAITQTAGTAATMTGSGSIRSIIAPYTTAGTTLTFSHTVSGDATPATLNVTVTRAPVRQRLSDGTYRAVNKRRYKAPSVDEPVASPRIAFEQPFIETSQWNLPVADSVQWEASATGTRSYSITTPLGYTVGHQGIWANQATDSHPFNVAAATDPILTITDILSAPRSGSARFPAGWKIASEVEGFTTYKDNHAHVLEPNGQYLHEMFKVERPNTAKPGAAVHSDVQTRRHVVVNLYGSGIGPQNGVRAYGGPAIGGIVLRSDIERAMQARDGLRSLRDCIPHATAWAISNDALYADHEGWDADVAADPTTATNQTWSSGVTNTTQQPGWTAGTARSGFSKRRGYVWPATEQDGASHSTTDLNVRYLGTMPMGGFFIIPPNVDIMSITGLDWSGRVLGYSLQDYGGYITDQASQFTISCDMLAPTDLRNAWVANNANQLRLLRPYMRAVTNNTQATPGGGTLGSARRRPLAPPIDTTP